MPADETVDRLRDWIEVRNKRLSIAPCDGPHWFIAHSGSEWQISGAEKRDLGGLGRQTLAFSA